MRNFKHRDPHMQVPVEGGSLLNFFPQVIEKRPMYQSTDGGRG